MTIWVEVRDIDSYADLNPSLGLMSPMSLHMRGRNNNNNVQFNFEAFAYNYHTQQISMVTLYGLGVISPWSLSR